VYSGFVHCYARYLLTLVTGQLAQRPAKLRNRLTTNGRVQWGEDWTKRGTIRQTRGLNWQSASMLLLTVAVVTAISSSAASLVFADYSPSYCVISNVHVSSVTPTDYSSAMVQVTTTFSFYCSGGTPGTIWNVQTRVYAESSLLGVSSISTSSSVIQYSFGEGTAQYVANNEFDAMSYYGYGEQTPSFYVQITAINTSTGSLDAQQQAPFAVDTSQYPFNLVQQNYCHFPVLSQFFQLLPGCGAGSVNSTVSIAPSNGDCNAFGLPQFFQSYLPGCGGTGKDTEAQNQSSSPLGTSWDPSIPGSQLASPNAFRASAAATTAYDRSIEAISTIIILALATCLIVTLVLKRQTRRLACLKLQGKFCPACGIHLQATANFCERCGEVIPDDEETYFFRV